MGVIRGSVVFESAQRPRCEIVACCKTALGRLPLQVAREVPRGECISRADYLDDVDFVRRYPMNRARCIGCLENLDGLVRSVFHHHARNGAEQLSYVFGGRDSPEFLCLVKPDENDRALAAKVKRPCSGKLFYPPQRRPVVHIKRHAITVRCGAIDYAFHQRVARGRQRCGDSAGVHPGGFGLLERVGLSGRIEQVVAEFSHGEQRQLELAMALALQPKLLMLDEPAAGFSPAERSQLITLLRELPQEISLLLIEHDMDIALAVANRVIVMHDGEKILEGTPDEIRSNQRVRQIYLGGSLDHAA